MHPTDNTSTTRVDRLLRFLLTGPPVHQKVHRTVHHAPIGPVPAGTLDVVTGGKASIELEPPGHFLLVVPALFVAALLGFSLTDPVVIVALVAAAVVPSPLRRVRRGISLDADRLTIRTWRRSTVIERDDVTGFELRPMRWRARRLTVNTAAGDHATPVTSYHDGLLPEQIAGDRELAESWGIPIDRRYTGQLPPPVVDQAE